MKTRQPNAERARNALHTLRKVAGVRLTLEGQTVEAWNGDRAVVQAVSYSASEASEGYVLLVRKSDNTLATWDADGLKVVTLDQPADTTEVSP